MNILQVCGTKRLSGLELLAYALTMRMKEDGHFVSIAAREGYGLAKLVQDDEITSVLYKGGINRLWYPLQIRNFIVSNKIDIVHFHQLRLLKRLLPFLPGGAGRPAYLFTDAVPHQNVIASKYTDYILNQVDLFMVCSTTHKQVSSQALGYPEEKITVLDNGVDTKVFSPVKDEQEKNSLREKYNIPLHIPCIALIGRVDESKGQDTLIEAAKILIDEGRQFRIEICGELKGGNSFVEKVKKMTADTSLEGCINLRGFVKNVPLFIKAIDIQVVPSVREPFGLVAAEAMATGLPVIVSSVGELPTIVQYGKCGLVVEHSSPEQLAKAIGRILDNPEQAVQMGKRGRERVLEHYSLKMHLNKLYTLYEKALKHVRKYQ
jgi:glycosyltransferase involved in cell wall biosynthesis